MNCEGNVTCSIQFSKNEAFAGGGYSLKSFLLLCVPGWSRLHKESICNSLTVVPLTSGSPTVEVWTEFSHKHVWILCMKVKIIDTGRQ